MSKVYELALPVFEPGDDLELSVWNHSGDLVEGLETQAKIYEDAAKMCRKLAGTIAEYPDVKVYANRHTVQVLGPEERLQELTRQGLLNSYEDGDILEDEEDFDDEEDSDYYDDEEGRG